MLSALRQAAREDDRGRTLVAVDRPVPVIRHAVRHKRPGVSYAVTDDGLELPVLDVTHPAFACELSASKQALMLERFLEEQRRFAQLPRWLQRALSRFFMRGSRIGRGLRRAEQSFLDGMTTYLFKLGPQNLGSYAVAVDRKLLGSLPAVSVRLRAGDMAQLLADGLAPRLRGEPAQPLHLLNIGGGPATDSLNALIVLSRADQALLERRPITLSVLDRDPHGPAFGARSLSALQEAGGPLRDLSIRFEHIAYDWSTPGELLLPLLAAERAGALVAVSSEGGLFEYGSDHEIAGNLQAIAQARGRGTFVVGSVTRDDEAIRVLKLTSTTATRPRGLRVFSELAASAGWKLASSIARPFSDQVLLVPQGADARPKRSC
jgi:hypothetical protein